MSSSFESNFQFIEQAIDDQATFERVFSAFVTLFVTLEEYMEEDQIAGEHRERFKDAVETFAMYLRVIDEIVPGLHLEGNCAFMERAARSGFPPGSQFNFFVRTLDGVRAPLAQYKVNDITADQCFEAMRDMLKAARVMESCLPARG